MKDFFKKMHDKEMTIFGKKFKVVSLSLALVFLALAIQSAINVGFMFSTGPFFWMVFWIFKLTFDVSLLTYNFNMGKLLVK